VAERPFQRFQMHTSGKSNRGSKLFTVVFAGALLLVGGGGWMFYRDTEGQIGHVKAKDGLATISAHALAMRGLAAQAEQPLLEALEQNGHAMPAMRWLSEALGDPDSRVKVAACRAVAALRMEHLVDGILPHLQHSERKVVIAAQTALESLSGTTCGTDPIAWRKLFDERAGR
jgi:hypothetical protein